MRTILCFLAVCLTLASCATTPATSDSVANRAAAFADSASGQKIQTVLMDAAFNAATQYATYGEVEAHKVVAATLDGSADSVRSLVTTPGAESPGAIARAVEIGSGVRAFDNTVAPIVAGVVMRQIQSGIPPEQAIENAATVMNKAAEKTRNRQQVGNP